jgi:hypothetical protein
VILARTNPGESGVATHPAAQQHSQAAQNAQPWSRLGPSWWTSARHTWEDGGMDVTEVDRRRRAIAALLAADPTLSQRDIAKAVAT